MFRKDKFAWKAQDVIVKSRADLEKETKRNLDGKDAEKAGNIDKAIKLYEQNVKSQADTPHPYKRLAIIYHKQKKYSDEARVLKVAISVFGSDADWYKERLNKLIEKGLI